MEGLLNVSPVLATDLWMVVCMGLRRSDTMRIHFQLPETTIFAGYIKLTERKNKHNCLRVVPFSLLKLMTATGTKFPITKERYMAVQRFSI